LKKKNESAKVRLKEKLDNLIFRAYNLAGNILFLFSEKRKLVKKNTALKNMYQGQRCFILGTGPSLKTTDFDLLKNELVFGVNFYYKSDLVNTVKPQFYCLYDDIFHTTHQQSTLDLLHKLPDTIFFLRTRAVDFIRKNNIDMKNIYFQHCNQYQYGDLVRLDMTKGMTAPFNVVLGCLQSAIYMGFKKIYLLGCDFNSFASLKVEHFYDRGPAPDRTMPLGFELKYYSLVSYHHYAIEKYARKNGIQIVNLTPNSLLDAYERDSLEHVMACIHNG
jgi:hypothetical protein